MILKDQQRRLKKIGMKSTKHNDSEELGGWVDKTAFQTLIYEQNPMKGMTKC